MKRNQFVLAFALAFGLPVGAQLQPARTIILIGPPGSGKTVQAEALGRKFQIPAVSMAQLLHQEINRKSPIGKAVAASLESGELLADGPANELVKARLLRSDASRGFVLDGYPASEGQARALDQWLSEHNLPRPTIVILNVPEEISRDRLVRRGRAADQRNNIERRLTDYRHVGSLVERWYGPKQVVRVDGTGTPADVGRRVAEGIDSVQSSKSLNVRPPDKKGLKQRKPEQ